MGNQFFDRHNSFDWGDKEETLFTSLPKWQDIMNDPMAMVLLHAGLFDLDATIAERNVAQAMIDEYWPEEFGYDFDEFFDWDGWREFLSPSGD